MKYLVIYDLGNASSAFCFNTYNEAVDYVNACSKYAEDYTIKLTVTDDNHLNMTLKNGKRIYVHIETVADSKVRFDLSFDKNGKHVETRRFTKRHLAVNFANKTLKNEFHYSARKKESDLGKWSIENTEKKLKVAMRLNLVIIDEVKIDEPDYDTLGVKPTDSLTKIKRAYRKQAIKHHPDKGGDPEAFKQIHEAYERILSGKTAKSATKQIIMPFRNIDMRFVFKDFKNMNGRTESILSTKSDLSFRQIRKKGARMMIYGSIGMVVSIVLALTLSGIHSQTKDNFIFVLVLVGFFTFVRGAIYFADSKAYLDTDL